MKSKDTAIKEVKGYSSAYPYICNLKLLPNHDGTWISILDDVGTSMTIKLSDLDDFMCCVLDKIKAEIQEYADNKAEPMEMRVYYHCLQIIDKYKGDKE